MIWDCRRGIFIFLTASNKRQNIERKAKSLTAEHEIDSGSEQRTLLCVQFTYLLWTMPIVKSRQDM